MFEQDKRGERRRLMESAQNGDRDAFLTLMRDLGPQLTGFLRRRIADRHELEDVCQETLMAIYESRHTYEASRPVEPWIFAIARHVAASHYRRQISSRALQELFDKIPEHLPETVESESACLVTFQQALGQLPPFQREAFLMTKIEGLSLREAAQRTGASVGTMKVRAHRAYGFLKKALQG
jgi:RNA polymerase sigma-70 factor (ECF subfamily)